MAWEEVKYITGRAALKRQTKAFTATLNYNAFSAPQAVVDVKGGGKLKLIQSYTSVKANDTATYSNFYAPAITVQVDGENIQATAGAIENTTSRYQNLVKVTPATTAAWTGVNITATTASVTDPYVEWEFSKSLKIILGAITSPVMGSGSYIIRVLYELEVEG